MYIDPVSYNRDIRRTGSRGCIGVFAGGVKEKGLVGEEEDFIFPHLLGSLYNVGNCFIFPIVFIFSRWGRGET